MPAMDLESLQGLRVLVVEDNFVLAESMKWALEGLGCEVVGMAPTSERALALLRSMTIDAAILDIDLQGLSSAPVAEHLLAAGLPFLFLTGYESAALLPESLHERRCLNKPVDPDALALALVAEIGQRG
ncbi:MAG: response regulator [Planctomycetota bacterium]|nr:response regulator [Planctomycetota bacterium]